MPTETQKRLIAKAKHVQSIPCSPPCDYHFSGGTDDTCSASTADYQQAIKRIKRKPAVDPMHTARDLRAMLKDKLDDLRYEAHHERLTASVEIFKHWLMDMQHERRMALDHAAQKVIQALIDRIK